MKRLMTVLALSAVAAIGTAREAVAVAVSVDLTGSVYDYSMTVPRGNGNATRTDNYTGLAAYSFSTSGGALEISVPAGGSWPNTFDPYLYLFEDDGDFSEDDLIAYNDDVTYGVVLDSYLSTSVPGGNYLVLLGQYEYRGPFNGGSFFNRPTDASYIDYVTGVVGGAAYQDVAGWNTLPQNGTVEASYNYEMTITGQDLVVAGVPTVPLPASAPLLLGALMIPAALRKLKRRG